MRSLKWLATAVLAGASGAAVGAAGKCTVTSPAHTVALVELFTSEGCSSCPPADAWLRGLPSAGFDVERVVPLSLHVDYWDYIGWKDRFAMPGFTERQRTYSSLSGVRFIYTPQVVLAGRDYRGWHGGGFERDVHAVNARPARAGIIIALEPLDPQTSNVRVTAQSQPPAVGAALYVAVYESGLASEVKRGENRGATLRHDYVVREWIGPIALGADGKAELAQRIAHADRIGVAAFVQTMRSGEILQATALAHCPG
jgi:hypothetical protein